MQRNDIPDPIADDAPTPDQFSDDETVRTPGTKLWDLVAVDHDGARYCLDCASDEYIEVCRERPGDIPAGGPVDRGTEVDHPTGCDNCHRLIVDLLPPEGDR